MATRDNKALVLFLKLLKHELLAIAEQLKTRILKRSDLYNIPEFNNAGDKEKKAVHEMVSEVAQEPIVKSNIGHDDLTFGESHNHGVSEQPVGPRGVVRTKSNMPRSSHPPVDHRDAA